VNEKCALQSASTQPLLCAQHVIYDECFLHDVTRQVFIIAYYYIGDDTYHYSRFDSELTGALMGKREFGNFEHKSE